MQQSCTRYSKLRKRHYDINPEEMIGIIELRSLGYYKIKQAILQQNLSRYYRFEKEEKLCEYFNRFVNTLKKEREQESPEKSIHG